MSDKPDTPDEPGAVDAPGTPGISVMSVVADGRAVPQLESNTARIMILTIFERFICKIFLPSEINLYI